MATSRKYQVAHAIMYRKRLCSLGCYIASLNAVSSFQSLLGPVRLEWPSPSRVQHDPCHRKFWATAQQEQDMSMTVAPDNDEIQQESVDATDLLSITFSSLSKDQEPQLLSNFLMEIGASSTSITDANRGTSQEDLWIDYPRNHGAWVADITWSVCNVTVILPASIDLSTILTIVRQVFPNIPDPIVSVVENKDWLLHVQESWKPIVVPPFCIRFPWHSDETVKETLQNLSDANLSPPPPDDSLVQIKMKGATAFGTGDHPTTRMCLEWIGRVCRHQEDVKRIIDYGTGTGILGIAACKLNPKIQAIGVDVDLDAVCLANVHAMENNVSMENYLVPLEGTRNDEGRGILLNSCNRSQGDVHLLPDKWQQPIYDICVANIVAPCLIELASVLANLVRPGGIVGLSGIAESQAESVITAYSQFFDETHVEQKCGGWVLITGIRKQN